MAEKIEEKRNANTLKVFGIILPSLPLLILRFGRVFLRFKRDAKKGARIFQKELENQGIDKATAEGLTETYLEGSDLLKYMKNFR